MTDDSDFFENTTENIDLSKYPNLERYFNDYVESDGALLEDCRLPNLIMWIRLLVEPDKGEWTDPTEFFEMEDDDAEEFCSWGSNSRWKNVFMPLVMTDPEFFKRKCLELAETKGDPNVEEWLKAHNV